MFFKANKMDVHVKQTTKSEKKKESRRGDKEQRERDSSNNVRHI